MDLKQVIVIDESLGMSKGKLAAQASHASLNAYKKVDEDLRKDWGSQGAKKIILDKGEKSFQDLIMGAERLNIPHYKVKDAGHTEVEPGTATALGLGPAESSKIDKITSELTLVK
ncbi:MAG: aminoacyl-tRNA hydrolase [Candidatus Nanohaloarchaea archaeon]